MSFTCGYPFKTMVTTYKKYYFFSTLMLFHFFCTAQNKGCIDSISFNKYYNQYFADMAVNPTQRDAADNFYLSSTTKIGGSNYATIIKFNAKNQLLWYKNYLDDQFFPEIVPYIINSIDKNANLVFVNFGINNLTSTYRSFISKTDSAGNFIWGKRIERIDSPSVPGGLYNDNGGTAADDGSTFYLHSTADDIMTANVVKIDANGNISWSKKYGNPALPQFRIVKSKIVYQEANVVVLFSHFFYDASSPANVNAKHGIQMVKINTTDGSLISQKTMMYYYDLSGTMPNQIDLQKLKYDTVKKQFLLDSRGQFMAPINKSHVISLFDEDLKHIKSNYFIATNFLTGTEDVRISQDNKLTITNRITSGVGPTTITYAAFDSNLGLTAQRKIVLNTIGFPNALFISNVTYKQNDILNFQLGLSGGNTVGNPIFLFDHSPYYKGSSNCLGYDTIVYTKSNIYTLPVNGITFNEINGIPLQNTSISYTQPILNLQMVKTELCKEISICDTIKLFGTQFHCLSNPFDSFKIFRNPLCVRKTNWQVDTAYIKILGSTDTSLHVQYLKPYQGSIKVGFGGCSLTDEIPIEVYAAQAGVNLGNDTLHCPGKTITLRAGKNFRTYLWQDGSSKDSLVAAQPGIYNVIATDSCGNVFKDTLTVNPFDGVLQVDYPQELCKNDVAVIVLPNNLINYIWQPSTNSSLNNYTWKLYPLSTTIYSITGERVPGCAISDTVLVNVKICPRYVYFPSAFTPNNDGINDIYKPSVAGSIVFYQLTIYNRYGQTVFTSSSPNEGWNGLFNKSSKPLPGSYVWFCRYKFFNRPEQQEKGTFVLIR